MGTNDFILGDMITLQRGFDITKNEQDDGVYPVVSSSGISSYHSKYMVKGPGVVIGRKGTLGTAFYVPQDFWPHDTSLWVKDFKGNDPYYVYCLLSSLHLEKLDSGSANPTLNRNYVHQIHVRNISIEEQRRISNVIHCLDITVLNRNSICSILESMAKTIYDYWFTQFDFPNAEGKPYRSSGGKMVWNEQLKREIPEGWKVGTIDSILAIDNNSVDPSKLGDTIMEHYSIPAFDDGKYPVYEPANTIESGKYAVNRECILTSKLNPHFKRLWDPYCDTDNAICSTEFIVYRPRDLWTRSYCYAVLNSDSFYAHMVSNATASTGSRKRIQPDVSASFQLAIPDAQTIRAFVKVYDPILKQLKNLRKENHELASLRDWLLPMLMNGQATVE